MNPAFNISTVYDSFIIGEATIRGHLKLTTERPINFQMYHGKTIVYEDGKTNIKRWTDGFSWSPSKLKGGFFIYECKEPEWKGLLKRTISVRSYCGRLFHVINYYDNREAEINPLIRPIDVEYPDIKSLRIMALEFTYIKCYRRTSKMCGRPCTVIIEDEKEYSIPKSKQVIKDQLLFETKNSSLVECQSSNQEIEINKSLLPSPVSSTIFNSVPKFEPNYLMPIADSIMNFNHGKIHYIQAHTVPSINHISLSLNDDISNYCYHQITKCMERDPYDSKILSRFD